MSDYIIAIIMGVFMGVSFSSAYWVNPAAKRACEANLPRHMECVWAAPIEEQGE